MVQIVDTGTVVYQNKALNIDDILKSIQAFTNTKAEIEKNKYIFRNLNIKDYEFINFISLSELRKNIRISVSFSYSRFESGSGNYNLCTRERSIKDTHTALIRLYRVMTGKMIKQDDLEITALDISNQLKVENIRNYYTVLDLIFRSLKRDEPNGRLYFDTDKETKRKQLDGLDFRERGKKRREASAYFKIYSKRKEEEDTGKDTKGHAQALRGELTLKGMFLKNWGLNRLSGVNKENLERVLKETLAKTIISGINSELADSVEHLKKLLEKEKTKKIRENILINEYHIFDIKILDIVLSPDVLGVSKRMCQLHKKNIVELLEKNSKTGEIKKEYGGNFERLKKLLKKIAKVDIKIDITEGAARVCEE